MRNIVLTTLVLLVFVGCSSPKSIMVMKDYANAKLSSKKLTVYLPETSIKIENADDVEDDLGKEENPTAVFYKFMKNTMPNEFFQVGSFQKTNFIEKITTGLTRVSFDLPDLKRKISIPLPELGHPFSADTSAEIILFIDDLRIDRYVTYNYSPTPYGFGGSSSSYLRFKSDFALWDNKAGKVITYGTVESSTSFLFAMTKDTWKYSLKDLAKEFLKESPFTLYQKKLR